MTDARDARMLAHYLNALTPYGIGADRLVLTYEDDLQDYDVLVLGGELTDRQIEGLFDASRRGGCLRFVDARNTTRWDEVLRREGAALGQALAVDTRRDHPDLPRFDRTTGTLADFARSLEVWAGFEPGSALRVEDTHTVTVTLQSPRPDFARFQMLVQATSVLAQYDIRLHLIGEDSD